MPDFLHTRVRVSDLDGSIKWYCEHLGFKVKSRSDRSPAGNQICHLELPGNAHTLELTYSPDYKMAVPEDLMHFAIGVPDLIALCDQLEKRGLEIWPGDWRKTFPTGRKMAFVDDPDGYEIELLERPGATPVGS
jgi:lactoylglutathione lyase